MKVFLDMDGVLVDFCGAVEKKYNMKWPDGVYDYSGFISKKQEKEIYTYDFFISVPPTEECFQILKGFKNTNFSIVTRSQNSEVYRAKKDWLKRRRVNCEVILENGSRKYLSGKDCLLVDDHQKNLDEWISMGGIGILIRRPWSFG